MKSMVQKQENNGITAEKWKRSYRSGWLADALWEAVITQYCADAP
jgi:hypothetical protein